MTTGLHRDFILPCVLASRIHDLGLLHNDIKPANLFLDADDNVLVGDLGLSCRWDANGNGHPAGSIETMAEEVARANPPDNSSTS